MHHPMAFMFPGQGSQYKGMADVLLEWAPARYFFGEFKKQLKYDFTLMDDNELACTKVTQPALYTLSCVHYEFLKSEGYAPFIAAGHSLGEYSAMYASGVFSFEDGLALVAYRGELMHEISKKDAGKMAAIIGLDLGTIKQICEDYHHGGEVAEAVNFNAENQIVVSGTHKAIDAVCQSAKASGAKRAIILPVSAPFHSSLMLQIREDFSKMIRRVPFKRPSIMIVQNVDGKVHQDPEKLRINLIRQLYSPVLWVNCMEEMYTRNARIFLECGPKKVLSTLGKNCGYATLSSEDILKKE